MASCIVCSLLYSSPHLPSFPSLLSPLLPLLPSFPSLPSPPIFPLSPLPPSPPLPSSSLLPTFHVNIAGQLQQSLYPICPWQSHWCPASRAQSPFKAHRAQHCRKQARLHCMRRSTTAMDVGAGYELYISALKCDASVTYFNADST